MVELYGEASAPERWTLVLRPSASLHGREHAEPREVESSGSQLEFEVRDLPLGGYDVEARAEGRNGIVVPVLLTRRNAHPFVVIGLSPASFLEGFLVDGDGLPVEGLAVTLRSTDGAVERTAVTDAAGLYRFEEVRDGPYRLYVGPPANPLVPAEALRLTAPGMRFPTLELARLGHLDVFVRDADGIYVPGVTVRGSGTGGGVLEGVTDVDGASSSRTWHPAATGCAPSIPTTPSASRTAVPPSSRAASAYGSTCASPKSPDVAGGPTPELGATSQVPALLRLAWPAVLSYALNNAYRVNDQFWIQGLGGEAQAAIAGTFFVQVMNFALVFLGVGGTLARVARATGAQDPRERDSFVRHALLFGTVLGLLLLCFVRPAVPAIVGWLGLEGEAARHGVDYLGTVYLFIVPLVLFPILDSVFLGRGNSRVPMFLQTLAVCLNYVLNPILIYGASVAEHVDAPGVVLMGKIAEAFDVEGRGMVGAGMATGVSRVLSVALGLLILRFGFGTRFLVPPRVKLGRIVDIVRISLPVSISIAVYAGAYWVLFATVLDRLGDDARAGLGVGFQVFEGLAFPCYLGVSIGASSLVGRAIGARDRATALAVVSAGRKVARVLGAAFALLFLAGGSFAVPLFTQDPAVEAQTLLYVRVLAFSQYWVAVETINEKVLLGAGYTKPILWIAPLGNALRVPLGWLLALGLGFGAAGLWWAINLTTYLKALLFWQRVEEGRWLEETLARMEAEGRATPGTGGQ